MNLDPSTDNDDLNEPLEELAPEGGGEDGLDPAFVSGAAKPKMSKGTLGALVLFLACGAGIYLMYLRHGPQSADAASVDAGQASNTINEFLTGDAGNVKLMSQTLKDTEKVVQEFRTSAGKAQVPVDALRTNPFRLTAAVKTSAVIDDPDAVVSRRRREEERQEVLKSVQALQLQSVLSGSRKACMINGTLYTEGQEADGFLVEQIAPSTVVVRKGMYRFELRMTK